MDLDRSVVNAVALPTGDVPFRSRGYYQAIFFVLVWSRSIPAAIGIGSDSQSGGLRCRAIGVRSDDGDGAISL